jgi:predicted amidophosphoribosyltransferase
VPKLLRPYGLRRFSLPWLLLDAMLPTLCFCCQARLGSTTALGACGSCWMGLDPAIEVTPLSAGQATVTSAVHYDERSRRYLLRAKFGRRQELFGPIGEMLLAAFRSLTFRPSCIVPVPSHPWVTWTRGFTPSWEIARVVSRTTGIPMRPLLQRRWLPWKAFKRLDRSGRRTLAPRAFTLRGGLNGETVLLIDDLMTTGNTLTECGRLCSNAGAIETQGLVWAKVVF